MPLRPFEISLRTRLVLLFAGLAAAVAVAPAVYLPRALEEQSRRWAERRCLDVARALAGAPRRPSTSAIGARRPRPSPARSSAGLVSVTAGARYDAMHASYVDVQLADRPTRSRRFEAVSPRLAVVLTPGEGTALKIMGARAFRAPAATELFPSNTAIQSSNPDGLRPETLDTLELAGTWLASDHVELRANGYWFRLRNLIGYDGLTVANLYTTEHAGAEVEALWDLDLGREGRLAGFANWAYAKLLHERSLGPGLDAASQLAWAPVHSAKAGLNYQWRRANIAATLLYQGAVARRPSDLLTPENRALRPDVIPAWATI